MQPKSSDNHAYPCPECANTGWIGPHGLDHAEKVGRGSGRVWYPYSGAANAYMTAETSGHWGECWLCKGSGLVEERRRKPERRKSGDRRAAVAALNEV